MRKLCNAVIIICLVVMYASLGVALTSTPKPIESNNDEISGDQNLPEYEVLHSIEEFDERIKSEVENGLDGDFHIMVSTNVTEDEIKECCRQLDIFEGRATEYVFSNSSQQDEGGPVIESDEMAVNVTYKRSIESYVYDAIMNGKDIPEDKTEASEVKTVVEQILKDCIKDGMSDYEKELAIHDYLINNSIYPDEASYEADYDRSSYGVLVKGKGVCEGYARTTTLLLRCCGVESKLIRVKEIKENTDETYYYFWTQVKLDGKWYNLDVSADSNYAGDDDYYHTYFNVTTDIMKKQVAFEETELETCDSMDMNYYNKDGRFFTSNDSFQSYVKSQLEEGNREMIECAITDLDLSQETLNFIFDYEGVSTYRKNWRGVDDYKVLKIIIN